MLQIYKNNPCGPVLNFIRDKILPSIPPQQTEANYSGV